MIVSVCRKNTFEYLGRFIFSAYPIFEVKFLSAVQNDLNEL